MHTFINTHLYREFLRFSNRQLANNLAESNSKEFSSTVLMLKMLETRTETRLQVLHLSKSPTI